MPFAITGVDHIGIRVLDAARSEEFYAKLGFTVVARHDAASVVILRNKHGVEINLIVNAEAEFDGTNVLMDVPPKRAGFTHVALRVESIAETLKKLVEQRIKISDGPVRLGEGTSIFVRDPDRNVIELRYSE